MKTVQVNELFDVLPGNGLELNKLTQSPSGVPFINRGRKNNGVSATVDSSEYEDELQPAYTISVAGGGSVMESFVQLKPYLTAYHVFVLKPKKDMTLETLLWYATVLRANKYKYSYGRQADSTLPFIRVPDLSELPSFVRNFDFKNYESERVLDNSLLKDVTQIIVNDKQPLIRLDHLFDIINGVASSKVTRNETKTDKYSIPYIRPSKWQETSIDQYVEPTDKLKNKIFPAETLYVSTDGAGSHTYAYVSRETFVPNSNVSVLIPKRAMSLAEKLVYATLITNNRFKFSYGRKPKGEQLAKILLPTIS